MEIPVMVGAGLIVIGVGVGIGRDRWFKLWKRLLVNLKLTERFKQRC